MKASRLFSIGDFRTVEIETPSPTGSEILMKVSACGICGSDIPRIFKSGTSNQHYPLTIGHEFGGEIVAVGENANKDLIGKKGAAFPIIPCNNCEQCNNHYYAMCESYGYLGSRNDGGFAEYCLLPSEWNFVEAPQNFDNRAFALIEPATVAQHAIRAAGNGESICIFGAGPIGIMASRWAKILGFKNVLLVDVVQEKVEFANSLGENCKIINNFSPEFDCVIEGTGFGSALGNAIDCVKPHGCIVLLGNPAADTQIKLSQHSNLLRKEVTVKGIWNSYYKGCPINEWEETIKALSNNKLQILDLITHEVGLDDLPNLCENIYNKKLSICKAIAKIVV